jgi:hypothetical protein
MSAFQRTIKYIAIAFAVFLAVMIVAGIANFTFAIVSAVTGGISNNKGKTIDFTDTFTGVTSLDIDNSTGKLIIKQGDEFKVEAEDVNDGFTAEVSSDGTLTISDDDSHIGFFWFNFNGFNNPSSKITVYLPEDFIAEEAYIDSGAGTVSIDGLFAESLAISAGAGSVNGNNIYADDVTFDGGVGSVTLTDVSFNDAELNCGVGSLNVDGELIGETEIDCGVGGVDLDLIGNVDDYDLEVDSGVGTIRLNGDKISDDYKTDKNAPNFIQIEGGVGDVQININE